MRNEVERVDAQRRQVIGVAKERCARLQEAISKCEAFERDLCNFQLWSQHMHQILNVRLSEDVNALDVPHEYKVSVGRSAARLPSSPALAVPLHLVSPHFRRLVPKGPC